MTLTHGDREFEALIGRPANGALDLIQQQSPQMYRWLLEGAFAGPLSDPRLSRRDRQVATVATLTALGTEQQLRVHLQAALNQGVTAEELRALCEHASVYAGFPRALNALAVTAQVLADAGHGPAVPVHHLRLGDHSTEVGEVDGITSATARSQKARSCGPAVVLVHALGLSWRMWEPVIHALAHGRRVLAYDIRGHGAAADAPPPKNMNVLADDLHHLMKLEGLVSAHIVGLSYGGAIAQTFAVSHPDAVDSLTLAATTDRPFASFEDRAAAVERDGTAAQVAPSLTRWFTPAALAENVAGVRYARECVLRGDPNQVAAAWRAFTTLDTAERIRRFDKPMLVLAGELDASTTPDVMRPIAASVQDARYVEMPGAPHMPTLERPDLVVEALDSFLPRGRS
jgi:3-oxoadipate enol-lactonase